MKSEEEREPGVSSLVEEMTDVTDRV